MFGIDSDLIVLIFVVILLILVFKLISELVVRFVVILVFAGLGYYYVYYHTDFFDKHKDNMIVQVVEDKMDFVSVFDFENNFCDKKNKSKTDEITCECIIKPLVKDLKSRYSDKELRKLQKDKARYLKEILAALKRNKPQILDELDKRGARDIWDNMLKELRRGKFLGN